jgi:DNA polymerase-3 subunit gamma/tau
MERINPSSSARTWVIPQKLQPMKIRVQNQMIRSLSLTCQSCKDLVANGPGSIDVIELDAATHGLVDDARDLRDKAFFAPVNSRYKIYIIDEAHQLGPGATNALLKVVEEPPPHVLFIFATTEPDKIISTIRSRTHHKGLVLAPFRS